MTGYFVKADGNDGASGLNDANAWKTWEKVFTFSLGNGFSPGDNILTKSGDNIISPASPVDFGSSGSSGNPITLGFYNGSARPVIRTAAEQRTQASDWEAAPTGGVHQTVVDALRTTLVWEDDIPIAKATDSTCADGNWFHTGGFGAKLFYKPTDAANPETHQINNSFSGSIKYIDQSFITIDGLDFRSCDRALIFDAVGSAISDIIVNGCNFHNIQQGIEALGNGSFGLTKIDYTNNSFLGCLRGLRLITNTDGSIDAEDCDITGNHWRDGNIHDIYSGGDNEFMGLQQINNSLVSKNTADGGQCDGITTFAWTNGRLKNNNIEKNILKNLVDISRGVPTKGITLGGSNTIDSSSGNVASVNLISNVDQGLRLVLGNVSAETANLAAHNVLYKCATSIFIRDGAQDYVVKNNISLDPVTHHVHDETGSTTLNINNNDYFPDGPAHFNFNSITSDFDNWKTNSSYDSATLLQNPLFQDPDGGDFRLFAGSPAINAGVITTVLTDFLGQAWGSSPDIGAFKFQAAQKVIIGSINDLAI